jgi:hypothetical protein
VNLKWRISDIERTFATGAADGFAIVIRRQFESQTTGAGDKLKPIDLSDDIANLMLRMFDCGLLGSRQRALSNAD